MRIAIWGSYEHGNFGDDLMAVIFALYLLNMGCKPIVYRLNKKIADRYNLEVTNDVDKLLSNADFVIIGGGGMLVVDPLLRRIFSKVARAFENDFKVFYSAIKKYKCSIYPISIGGNGDYRDNLRLPRYRSKVFSCDYCRQGTVRLRGEEGWGKQFNILFKCVPDILLGTSKIFKNINAKSHKNIRIGINIVGKKCLPFAVNIEKLAYENSNIEIIYIQTHLEEYGFNYELTAKNQDNNRIQNFCHNDSFERTFELLASLDVLVSSKLHLGVTAMTFGTPFISYYGKKKTESFLEEVSWAKTVYRGSEETEIINFIRQSKNIRFDKIYNMTALQEDMDSSLQHLERLKEIVKSYSNGSGA